MLIACHGVIVQRIILEFQCQCLCAVRNTVRLMTCLENCPSVSVPVSLCSEGCCDVDNLFRELSPVFQYLCLCTVRSAVRLITCSENFPSVSVPVSLCCEERHEVDNLFRELSQCFSTCVVVLLGVPRG